MTFVLLLLVMGGAVLAVQWFRRRRMAKVKATTPLAGMDTGVRSVYRSPVKHKRGF